VKEYMDWICDIGIFVAVITIILVVKSTTEATEIVHAESIYSPVGIENLAPTHAEDLYYDINTKIVYMWDDSKCWCGCKVLPAAYLDDYSKAFKYDADTGYFMNSKEWSSLQEDIN